VGYFDLYKWIIVKPVVVVVFLQLQPALKQLISFEARRAKKAPGDVSVYVEDSFLSSNEA
jgi:predicted Kef-type K+ transport protein